MIVDDNHPAWISDTFQISICFLEFFLSIILLQEVLSTNEKKNIDDIHQRHWMNGSIKFIHDKCTTIQ